MKNLVENRNGWIWPKTDINCYKYMMSHPDLPKKISEYVTNRSVCIQAGGNMGYYVKQYSKIFETVYTFEPEPINFYCLNQNITEENVIKIQSCLGNERQQVGLKVKQANRGKNFVNSKGIIPVLRIDDLGLESCDLIHLDIEGYELFALQGAVETLKNTNTIVALEYFEKCSSRYSYSLDDLETFLKKYNYKLIGQFEEERIYSK